ncbi:hypothetical protein C4D60_Mb06t12790 [Musa balbisiana]|uniref:Uncharacterized protein n=1 Tax=Musa balbisiana TaxID=52838 RepID=A0A4S8IMJ6_MUSBA|nr:hypothetical protein C4D60_Mb06t12790 [Musa balbisiana]
MDFLQIVGVQFGMDANQRNTKLAGQLSDAVIFAWLRGVLSHAEEMEEIIHLTMIQDAHIKDTDEM